jgi:hypothetical protein
MITVTREMLLAWRKEVAALPEDWPRREETLAALDAAITKDVNGN